MGIPLLAKTAGDAWTLPLGWRAAVRAVAPVAKSASGPTRVRRGVTDLLAGEQTVTELVDLVQQRSGRVQLNFNLADRPGEKPSRKPDLDALRVFVASRPSLPVITQQHEANLPVHAALRQYVNHAVLFDTSGGNGIAPAAWPRPLSGTACGYAGGLGPEVIDHALPEIAKACGDASIWIDMEGRLRTVDDAGDD